MVNKKKIIVAKNAPDRAKYTLENMGYGIIESTFLENVQPPLAYHPDMQIVKCGKDFICAPGCYDYYKEAADLSLLCGNITPEYDYPADIAYNIAVTGKYAIHNFAYSDPLFLEKSPYVHIRVKQGYSKCSVCVVAEDAIITSDKGIAASCSAAAGPDVLQISPGHVLLPGYEYGFIGGASGLIDDGVLAFCGDIALHPDYDRISDFCKKHRVAIVSLCEGLPTDVGTIISLG